MDIKQICSWDNDLAVLSEDGTLWRIATNEDPLELAHVWRAIEKPNIQFIPKEKYKHPPVET